MPHKQLGALITKTFLGVHAVSCYLNIDSTTVLGWMKAETPGPTSAIAALSGLDAKSSQAEEATIFRTLGVHQGFVLQVIAHLKDLSFYAYQVPFEQERYFQELKSEESFESFQVLQSKIQKRSDA